MFLSLPAEPAVSDDLPDIIDGTVTQLSLARCVPLNRGPLLRHDGAPCLQNHHNEYLSPFSAFSALRLPLLHTMVPLPLPDVARNTPFVLDHEQTHYHLVRQVDPQNSYVKSRNIPATWIPVRVLWDISGT